MLASDLIAFLRKEVDLMGDREVVVEVLDDDGPLSFCDRNVKRVSYKGVSIVLEAEV